MNIVYDCYDSAWSMINISFGKLITANYPCSGFVVSKTVVCLLNKW